MAPVKNIFSYLLLNTLVWGQKRQQRQKKEENCYNNQQPQPLIMLVDMLKYEDKCCLLQK